ncbi:hypothetical protein BMETH_2481_0 [methanotrophic bacterial endosymbiont of Bathymodiolus sp.]|nr:hypothetical protein BMETH_2481_0 [methanotrophic bacterial endosymbiont of Bathymodiolus sp.]
MKTYLPADALFFLSLAKRLVSFMMTKLSAGSPKTLLSLS